ncbi:3-deoxy-D-arabinoheptulosonate-7-phosphate synthase [Catalinimonas alkaloidigena]|uniref:chorismate mutase n=1 Tax=Catalinimonas alkaloidigena TaxID=1075417 RepID=A0A1G9BGR1_9BACT|nr:bifunctional 3-deoxy-7-phosphoheptulonate synthase/chorismate mutase type II [Catalinimonas alkaloidigena]SDK38692.1 3-deoxy-D-arabinoheptulosonate-7-phosphate synthase [Catalinimonas alkaloidigena]
MKTEIQSNPLLTWVGHERKPLIIAGPCSVESEEQLREVVLALKDQQVDMIRVGIWKPRTRPNSFEGLGETALPWVQSLKAETGMRFATEVATPEHIDLALKYGIDTFWIGARTTVNPFNVQALADALRGMDDIPVMIKNPVNPDLALWVGAIERIAGAGIKNLAAIHRGFSGLGKGRYRNAPVWQLPIELKRILPDLPLICDPSHIGGKRDLIQPLAQKALDLNYDGLMIETHPNPDEAWSDASQQVTPARLGEILAELRIRKPQNSEPEYVNHLEELRHQLDQLDHELVEVLAARKAVVEKIGQYKKDNNVVIFDVNRWDEVFKSRAEWAEQMNVNRRFVEEIFKLVHVESIRQQTNVAW